MKYQNSLKLNDKIKALRSFNTLVKGKIYNVDNIADDGTVILNNGVFLYGPGAIYQRKENVSWIKVE